MKTSDIWMPFYVGDYMRKTMHLNTTQHGAYVLLILAYWERKKPLPADDKQLSAISRLSLKEWKLNSGILADFFDTDSDKTLWVHRKIEELLDRSKKLREAAVDRGKKGAAKKYGK